MGVEAQRDPRFKKRVPCRVTVGGSSTSAMVLNVSRRGLFVQTGAPGRPGESVRVHLNPAQLPQPIEIDAQVVWRRTVASHLRTLAKGGMGLAIRNAPPSYFGLVMDPSSARRAAPRTAAAAAAEAPAFTFLMRLRHEGGPRTRKLYVQANDEADARLRTRKRFGDEWTVLEIEQL